MIVLSMVMGWPFICACIYFETPYVQNTIAELLKSSCLSGFICLQKTSIDKSSGRARGTNRVIGLPFDKPSSSFLIFGLCLPVLTVFLHRMLLQQCCLYCWTAHHNPQQHKSLHHKDTLDILFLDLISFVVLPTYASNWWLLISAPDLDNASGRNFFKLSC